MPKKPERRKKRTKRFNLFALEVAARKNFDKWTGPQEVRGSAQMKEKSI